MRIVGQTKPFLCSGIIFEVQEPQLLRISLHKIEYLRSFGMTIRPDVSQKVNIKAISATRREFLSLVASNHSNKRASEASKRPRVQKYYTFGAQDD